MNKYLKAFWNKIHGAFLAAIQNENVKRNIEDYRKTWNLHGHASTPDELEGQIRQMFLKDAGLVNGAEITGFGKIRRDGNKVFVTAKGENGRETESYWQNPFHLVDGHQILVPEWKQRLIHILSNTDKLQDYSWVFEPRLLSHETIIVYPSSHISIDTLHKTCFLRSLRFEILHQLNLDYFLHWPLFFYYILTGDSDFVLKNIAFQFMPYRVFVVDDEYQNSWLIKSFGNAGISLLQGFVKTNKEELEKLTNLLNNPNVSGRSPKELNIFMNSSGKKNRDLALKYKPDMINQNLSGYSKILVKQQAQKEKIDSSYLAELDKIPTMLPAKNSIKTSKSRAKKLVENITRTERVDPRVKKLVDEINNHL